MGTFLNVGNAGFQSARNSEYIDKSPLIAVVNRTINTERQFSCVTRSRRFGKSMAAKMLCAYYDQSCDSRSLFSDLMIASDPSFEQHLNKYPVIFLDLSDFVTRFHDERIVSVMDTRLKEDIQAVYPDIPLKDDDDLMDFLIRIVAAKHQKFIFVIDEWDAICREFEAGSTAMDTYLSWLRRLFKGGQTMQVFAAVYMTGILPVKKYKMQSSMNNFLEYSMVEPGDMAQYFGFTKDEVRTLAAGHDMDFDELEKWYVRMLAGERCKVNPTKFQNDMSVVRGRDDVLTVLIHLGYLSYNWRRDECYIPNREVAGEMVNAVELASGKGFADIVLIPRKNVDSPAIVLELKCNKDADSAIDQIRRKQYPAKVAEYADRLLLVGISYDRETKQHSCRIEKC